MGLSLKQVSSDNYIDWNKALLEDTRSLKFPKNTSTKIQQQQQKEPLNCPRCDSTNTKFCYYNNYNKSQPRHFCKACNRHWTNGGTLRNVPVGGGRKNKRLKTFKNASKTTTPTTTTTTTNVNNNNNTNLIEENSFCDPFYQTQTSITFSNNNKGLLLNDGIFQHQNYDQEIHIPYSNLGAISSIESPNLYNFTSDHENNGGLFLDSTYDTSAAKIPTNSRNWESSLDDFDKFVSVEVDDLSISWDDDSEIKHSELFKTIADGF